jgi:RNA polymerase sigma factor (sigma-70 family)
MALIAPTCSEQELIAAARDGSDLAFEELYSRYRERIGAFILGRVHDHGRAEDIAQEVFIAALRRLRANDRAIAFKPWIYEIAKNACIDEFRRSRRTREVSLDADGEFEGGHRALLSIAPTPPAAVESKQRLEDLRGAFGGLSGNHHQLLVMREFEGLSYEEIGVRTGMSRQMVESALFRARRKLTEEYDELASGRRCQQVQSAIEDGRALALRSFGIRERRRLTRHLAHCQPCRVKAHLAGVDESLIKPRSIGAKIAALLPIPLWRWPWRGGSGARDVVVRTGSHHVALQSVAAAAEPAAATTSLGAAAVTAAAIALAGVGGAVLGGLPTRPGHPVRATPAGALNTRMTSHGSSPALPATPTINSVRLPASRTAGSASAARRGGHRSGNVRRAPAAGGPLAAGTPAKAAPGGSSGSSGSTTGLPDPVHGSPAISPTSATGSTAVPGVAKTAPTRVPGLANTVSSVLSRPLGSAAPTATPLPPPPVSSLPSTVQTTAKTVTSAVSTGTSAVPST